MSVEREGWRQGTGTHSIPPISDTTRRKTLRVLYENSDVLSTECLVERLMADSDDLATTDRDTLRVQLHHVHLPKLEDWGFINWDKEDQAVSTTDRSVDGTAGFHELTVDRSEGETPRAVTDDRSLSVLEILESENESITREGVAQQLAEQEFDSRPTESQIETIGVELHHKHLPKLAAAGFIEYNAGDGIVESLESV